MKKLLTFSLILSLSFVGKAQNDKQVDSLRAVIAQAEGADKMEPLDKLAALVFNKDPQLLYQISKELEDLAKQNNQQEFLVKAISFRTRSYQMQSKFDSLLIMSRKGLRLANEIQSDEERAIFYNYLGIYHEKKGVTDSAIYYYNLSLEMPGAKRLPLYNNIALAYSQLGVLHKSAEYLDSAIIEAKKQKNVAIEAIVSNNIGNVYMELEDQAKAKSYFLKSIELKEQIGDERGKLFALYNLIRLDLPKTEQEEYLKRGLEISKAVNDQFLYPIFLTNQAGVLAKKGRFEEALAIVDSVYQNEKENKTLAYLETLSTLTNIHLQMGNLAQAQIFGKEALRMGLEKNNFQTVQTARSNLLEVYKARKDYKSFFEIAETYFPAKDSIDRRASLNQMAYLESQLKNVEQEKEIETLNNTLRQREVRRYWIIAMACLVALILSLILYFRNRQVNVQKQLVIQEKKVAQELENINRELVNLDEMKSRFFTNISHELRTPITLIVTPIEHLLQKHASKLKKEMRSALQIIHNNARHLLSLVEELLELSRIEAGKQELNLQLTAVVPFCKQLFSTYESKAKLQKIQLSFHADLSSTLQAEIDRKRLAKIINNLLGNALKFTPSGGAVTMRVWGERVNPEGKQSASFRVNPEVIYQPPPSQPPPHHPSFGRQRLAAGDALLTIQVTDTGRGIPPADLPHIFDRYFQTKLKGISNEGGTGIGLALAKELTTLMNGNLFAESKWEKGSTFTLSVPLNGVQTSETITASPLEETTVVTGPTTEPSPTITNSADRKKSILIVEDNLEMQQLLQGLLAESYHCIMANDGAAAWKLLDDKAPAVKNVQLILSDIMMPNLNGYALLDRIKKHKYWQQIPVVMLTARAAEEDKLTALQLGVDDYLIKPFSPGELLARVNNLVVNYQQRKDFIATNTQIVDLEFDQQDSANRLWLKAVIENVQQALDKKLEINTVYLSEKMALSERQLLRRIKSLTGLSVQKYVQEIKLQKARHLLENQAHQTISEVSYACGFNTPGYFAQIFTKRFGKRPADYFN